jgi:hypothetical protein
MNYGRRIINFMTSCVRGGGGKNNNDLYINQYTNYNCYEDCLFDDGYVSLKGENHPCEKLCVCVIMSPII